VCVCVFVCVRCVYVCVCARARRVCVRAVRVRCVCVYQQVASFQLAVGLPGSQDPGMKHMFLITFTTELCSECSLPTWPTAPLMSFKNMARFRVEGLGLGVRTPGQQHR
jgi:hypothetical protein